MIYERQIRDIQLIIDKEFCTYKFGTVFEYLPRLFLLAISNAADFWTQFPAKHCLFQGSLLLSFCAPVLQRWLVHDASS